MKAGGNQVLKEHHREKWFFLLVHMDYIFKMKTSDKIKRQLDGKLKDSKNQTDT